MSHYYFCVVDLEATCCDQESIPQQEMETIEIGAVLVHSETLQTEEEFCQFIQPIRHPLLTPFCTELTSITQETVAQAPLFPEAIQSFQEWLSRKEHPVLFCSWGGFDKKQFLQDCTFHNTSYPFSPEHCNLKSAFSEINQTKRRYGMKAALETLNIPLEGIHHRGLDDAKNIAKILPWLREKGWKSVLDS